MKHDKVEACPAGGVCTEMSACGIQYRWGTAAGRGPPAAEQLDSIAAASCKFTQAISKIVEERRQPISR